MIGKLSQFDILLQKIKQHPPALQQQILEIYIVYVLQADNVDDIYLFCLNLLKKEDIMPGFINAETLKEALQEEAGNVSKMCSKLDYILASFRTTVESDHKENVYTKLNNLELMLDEIREGLITTLSNTKQYENLTVSELLSCVQHDKKQQDKAMRHAMQISFDRLFESMDPDSAEKHLDQSLSLIGPLKKSALFDAMKEKYQQLQEYHLSGNFSRDFRVTYKRYLRTINKLS